MRWFINAFEMQILIIELMLFWRLPKRKGFWLRLIPLSVGLHLLPKVMPGGYGSAFWYSQWLPVSFLVMLVLSAVVMWCCFKLSMKQLVFYCCIAHTLQHIVHCCARILYLTFAYSTFVSQLVEAILLALALIAGYQLRIKQFRSGEAADIKSIYVLVFAVISSFTIYFASVWTTSMETETIGEQFFDVFSCVLLLMVCFDFFKFHKAERDQEIVLRLLRQEQEQHELSKATIEMINRKCHDLKHQISALRNMSDREQERSIAELESAVLIYDSFPKSGNDDLDIILAEKSLLAEKQQISLQYMVDGKRIGFLSTEDIYSLLGNALDNAIEATMVEENVHKRIIEMTLYMRGDLLNIHISNPCPKKPSFVDGIPETTKQDTDYHGYGMLSMRYIVEKYDGGMATSWDDGVFSLDIIIPSPQKK